MPKKIKRRPTRIAKATWDGVDVPELSAADLKRMRPTADVVPAEIKRKIGERGKGKKEAKILVSVRLDPEVLASYRATGPKWQTRINATLRANAPKKPVPDRMKSGR